MKNRAGKAVQNLSGEMAYSSFYPQPLPPQPNIEIDTEMQQLLIDAHKKLALLNGLSDRIPNKDLFISMYVRKEALVSSQIEGTQCTLEDVLNPEIDENANADVSDVVNYVRAINFAIKRLEDLPLCNRLIRETHEVLMSSVRGGDKTPGEFRTSQNWIGGNGSTLRNARYIPPNPQDMVKCMSDFEQFMNNDDDMDPLIKTALLHYQFETIHPFLDGNGRVGRLLITLFLMGVNEISSPVLYLSCYLKLNRIEYYDRMSEVRVKGDYVQWVKFFLRGIAESAKDAISSIHRLHNLHEENLAKLEVLGRARINAIKLFSYIEQNPIIDIQKTAKALQLSYNTVDTAIKRLCALSILERNPQKSKKTFIYAKYIEILKNGTD